MRSPGSPALDPSRIDAVVLDVGGVFVVPHGELVAGHLRAAGVEVEPGDDRYHRAHHRGVRALSDQLGDDRTGHDESDPAFWRAYHRAYVAALGVADHRLDDARRALARLFGSGAGIWRQPITVNIAALGRLAAVRPLAIVSNNDGTAEAQLLEFGVCQVGDGPLPSVAIVVDSGVLGVAKPDPAIFRPALEALGTDAARTLYVGDTVHADVHGARAAGMAVVQLDPYDDHAGFDHHRLRHLGELADLLGG
jgi:putative hydrolase of the HAD superfamily